MTWIHKLYQASPHATQTIQEVDVQHFFANSDAQANCSEAVETPKKIAEAGVESLDGHCLNFLPSIQEASIVSRIREDVINLLFGINFGMFNQIPKAQCSDGIPQEERSRVYVVMANEVCQLQRIRQIIRFGGEEDGARFHVNLAASLRDLAP